MRHGALRQISLLVVLLLSTAGAGHLPAAEVREPVCAGSFYPATRAELHTTIESLTAAAEKSDRNTPAASHLRALIIPHAGYIYSGYTAAHCIPCLAGRRFSKVIVMGPDHRIGIPTAAISSVTAYETPLGRIGLHRDADRLRQRSNLFTYSPASDLTEHSVEVVLPFLQYSLGDFQLIPVVIGGAAPHTLAAALETVMDSQTLLVASSDLSHYLSYRQAVGWDSGTLELIKALEPGELMARQNSACGRAGIAVILHLARKHNWRPALLNYTNSGDTAGDKNRVVGYAAMAFYQTTLTGGNIPMEDCYQKEEGAVLLEHARRTIMEELGRDYDRSAADQLEEKLQAGCFDTKSGTFVTLTKHGQLRGCIGNMDASVNLRDGVRQNALNAAFRDPRFNPLTAAELAKVHIEISILTQPQPLVHAGGDDLIGKLRPNIDGVIISKGPNRATFLPQVWKQLPRPESFLDRLCMKAGLPADTWQSDALDVQTYQVISFEEEP